MRTLLMFPGQGSQRPGMAAELLDRFAAQAGPVFALADEVLDLPLTELCLTGSAEQLQRTEITQPAVLATSLAILEVLRAGGVEASAAAGHSLGEYGALVAAGVLTPASALLLVRRRGELMAWAGGEAPDGVAMAAVIGLPASRVEQLCAAIDQEQDVVEVANYNEPLQTVVSGNVRAVGRLTEAALAAGAERVVNLKVGAAFHCRLMRPAAQEFAAELGRHPFAEPRSPVLSAVTGGYLRSAEQARQVLARQLTAPVRWVDILRRAIDDGHQRLVEVGPGRVLTGTAKRIAPDLPAYGTGNARALESLLKFSPQTKTHTEMRIR
jgi:[acyl-carrier-protein] S-malonyltransferase